MDCLCHFLDSLGVWAYVSVRRVRWYNRVASGTELQISFPPCCGEQPEVDCLT